MSPLAKAHIGAALLLMGDQSRANSAFDQAVAALGFENTGNYYQSSLRDVAGVLALASEVQQTDRIEALSEALVKNMKDPERMNTQEKGFVLLASQALLRASGPLSISVDGKASENDTPAPQFTPAISALQDDISYRNESDGQIFRSLTVSGAPKNAPPAVSQGFTLSKRIATRAGRAVDLASVKQNDRLVVVVTGAGQNDRLHPAIIADLLPAGFEIEAILTPDDGAGQGKDGPYKWIGKISRARIAEARDDRFVAAVDVRSNRFTLAYVVRAITPGSYVLPGAVIEDMYRPQRVATTEAKTLQVTPFGDF